MHWFFILPLAIVLISAYILKYAADEIAYLCAIILLVSLFVSLVIAPWQIQCLLLMLILFSKWRVASPQNSSAESQENQKQQLTYRGANYPLVPPPVESAEAEMSGKYRGHVWKSH